MEGPSSQKDNKPSNSATIDKRNFLEVSCNWQINTNKEFIDTITTVPLSQKPENIDIDDLVSFDTGICVRPKQPEDGPCMIEIKTTNGQKISHIAIASGASTLEFFKQCGEYERTVVAQVYEELKPDADISFAETAIRPHATEASIKFTKRLNAESEMWIYGIRLYLTEPIKDMDNIGEASFNLEMIKSFLTKCAISQQSDQKDTKNGTDGTVVSNTDLKKCIRENNTDMQSQIVRLAEKLEEMDQHINHKLNWIADQLECIKLKLADK